MGISLAAYHIPVALPALAWSKQITLCLGRYTGEVEPYSPSFASEEFHFSWRFASAHWQRAFTLTWQLGIRKLAQRSPYSMVQFRLWIDQTHGFEQGWPFLAVDRLIYVRFIEGYEFAQTHSVLPSSNARTLGVLPWIMSPVRKLHLRDLQTTRFDRTTLHDSSFADKLMQALCISVFLGLKPDHWG